MRPWTKLWVKQQLFFVKLLVRVFYENWLRYPRREGTLMLDLDKYSVRVEPEETAGDPHK